MRPLQSVGLGVGSGQPARRAAVPGPTSTGATGVVPPLACPPWIEPPPGRWPSSSPGDGSGSASPPSWPRPRWPGRGSVPGPGRGTAGSWPAPWAAVTSPSGSVPCGRWGCPTPRPVPGWPSGGWPTPSTPWPPRWPSARCPAAAAGASWRSPSERPWCPPGWPRPWTARPTSRRAGRGGLAGPARPGRGAGPPVAWICHVHPPSDVPTPRPGPGGRRRCERCRAAAVRAHVHPGPGTGGARHRRLHRGGGRGGLGPGLGGRHHPDHPQDHHPRRHLRPAHAGGDGHAVHRERR